VKFVSQNYYEILDTNPSATEEDVKRSYRLVRRSFEPESMAIYSLYSPEETEAIGAKIDEAFGILTNRDRRRCYDKYLQFNDRTAAAHDGPDAFFDAIHDINELVPLEEFVEDAMDAAGQAAAVVSAEVQIEDDDPIDIDTAEGIELCEAAAEVSLEQVVDGPGAVLELPFAEALPQPAQATPCAVADDDDDDDDDDPIEEESTGFSLTSSDSTSSSPRLRAWSRELADERRSRSDSIKLMPLTEEMLTEIRKPRDKGLSGQALRKLREQRGVDLDTICAMTKISIMYLRFIEQDCYENLPAPIYLKGFVDQYARILELPGEVVGHYMHHYKRVCG